MNLEHTSSISTVVLGRPLRIELRMSLTRQTEWGGLSSSSTFACEPPFDIEGVFTQSVWKALYLHFDEPYPQGGPSFTVRALTIEPPLHDTDDEEYRVAVDHVLGSLAGGAYMTLLRAARAGAERGPLEREANAFVVPATYVLADVKRVDDDVELRLHELEKEWSFNTIRLSLGDSIPLCWTGAERLDDLVDRRIQRIEAMDDGTLRVIGEGFHINATPDEDGFWHFEGTGAYEWLTMRGTRGQCTAMKRVSTHYTGWETMNPAPR